MAEMTHSSAGADSDTRPTPPDAFRLVSPRLEARCWSTDDAPAFRALLDANDRHLRPFIPWMRQEPQPLEATRARLETSQAQFLALRDFRYALFERGGDLIGELLLSTRSGPGSREVGYLIDHRHTGRGYATEASRMALRTAFDLAGVERVTLLCSPENGASVRVATKLGFSLIATHPDRSEDSEGRRCDLMEWHLSREAYRSTPAARQALEVYDRHGKPLPLED